MRTALCIADLGAGHPMRGVLKFSRGRTLQFIEGRPSAVRLEFGRRIEELDSVCDAMVRACSLLVQKFPDEGTFRFALARGTVSHGREHAAPLRLAQLLEVKIRKLTRAPVLFHVLSARDISLDADIGNINEDGSLPNLSWGSLPHHEVLYSLSRVVRA